MVKYFKHLGNCTDLSQHSSWNVMFNLLNFPQEKSNELEESQSCHFHWLPTSFESQMRLNSPAMDHTSTA